MRTYQVLAKQVTYFIAEVEAENLDMAREMSEAIDYDEFKELSEIEWDVVDISEVEHEA